MIHFSLTSHAQITKHNRWFLFVAFLLVECVLFHSILSPVFRLFNSYIDCQKNDEKVQGSAANRCYAEAQTVSWFFRSVAGEKKIRLVHFSLNKTYVANAAMKDKTLSRTKIVVSFCGVALPFFHHFYHNHSFSVNMFGVHMCFSHFFLLILLALNIIVLWKLIWPLLARLCDHKIYWI